MKYKCAKCGGVFLQKVTENSNFRNWNRKQREITEHDLDLELKNMEELRTKELTEGKELLRLGSDERNRKKSKQAQIKWRAENRELYNKLKLEYYHENLRRSRECARVRYWRRKQKQLALAFFENDEYKPIKSEIFGSVSTIALSQLLRKR